MGSPERVSEDGADVVDLAWGDQNADECNLPERAAAGSPPSRAPGHHVKPVSGQP
jgi:hypothetical protein